MTEEPVEKRLQTLREPDKIEIHANSAKRPKKEPGAATGKNVVVLRSTDVTSNDKFVFMPNTIEMAQIKKADKGQFKTNVHISSKMTEKDIQKALEETFPILRHQRFYCAAAVENRSRLDFNGERRIWDGRSIKKRIKGNSALYILMEEESEPLMLKQSHDQMRTNEQSKQTSGITSEEIPSRSLSFHHVTYPGYEKQNECGSLFKHTSSYPVVVSGPGVEKTPDLPPTENQFKDKFPAIQNVFLAPSQHMPKPVCSSSGSIHSVANTSGIVTMATSLPPSFPLGTFLVPAQGIVAAQPGPTANQAVSAVTDHQSIGEPVFHAPKGQDLRQTGLPIPPQVMVSSTITPQMNRLNISNATSQQLQKPVIVKKSTLQQDSTMTTSVKDSRSLPGPVEAASAPQGAFRFKSPDQSGQLHDDSINANSSQIMGKGACGGTATSTVAAAADADRHLYRPEVLSDNYEAFKSSQETPISSDTGFDEKMDISFDADKSIQDLDSCNWSVSQTSGDDSLSDNNATKHDSDRSCCDDQVPVNSEASNSTSEELLSNQANANDDDLLGVVLGIFPPSGPPEGGKGFIITLTEELSEDDMPGIAHFDGIDDFHGAYVRLERHNSSAYSGVTPPSQKLGDFPVTVYTRAGRKLGMTYYTYKDDEDEMVKKLVNNPAKQASFFAKWSMECYNFGRHSDFAQNLNITQEQGSLPQTKHAQALKVLQLLVYTAAQTDAQQFIKMIFSTSAGKIVFNSYKGRTPLPEDVARANGHDDLAQYLQDVNTRLTNDGNEDSNPISIDWFELVTAVNKIQKQTSIADDETDLESGQSEDDDNTSDNFADAETSSSSSSSSIAGSSEHDAGWPDIDDCDGAVEIQSDNDGDVDYGDSDNDYDSHDDNDDDDNGDENNEEPSTVNYKPSWNDGWRKGNRNDWTAISTPHEKHVNETQEKQTVIKSVVQGVVETSEENASTGEQNDNVYSSEDKTMRKKEPCEKSDYSLDNNLVKMPAAGFENSGEMMTHDKSCLDALDIETINRPCMTSKQASMQTYAKGISPLFKNLPNDSDENFHNTALEESEELFMSETTRISANSFKASERESKDLSPSSVTDTPERQPAYSNSKPERSDTVFRVTLLASGWSSSMEGITRQLAISLAKHKQVEVTLLVPQLACSEEEMRAARSHNVAIREAERRPGYEPLDWLSFPPSDLTIDIVVGYGSEFRKQAQFIRESHNCIWMQVEPEELENSEGISLNGYGTGARAVVELKDRSGRLIFVCARDGKQDEAAGNLLMSRIFKDHLTVKKLLTSKERLIALKDLFASLLILVSGNSGFVLFSLPSDKPLVVDSAEPEEWAKANRAVYLKDRAERLAEAQRLWTCNDEMYYSWIEQFENRHVNMMLSSVYGQRNVGKDSTTEEKQKRSKQNRSKHEQKRSKARPSSFKLSVVLKRKPKFVVVDELALCLDRETRAIQNWKHLASELKVDEDVTARLEQYGDFSPTTCLFEYLTVTQPEMSIQQLKQALLDTRRNDLFSFLTTKDSLYVSKSSPSKEVAENLSFCSVTDTPHSKLAQGEPVKNDLVSFTDQSIASPFILTRRRNRGTLLAEPKQEVITLRLPPFVVVRSKSATKLKKQVVEYRNRVDTLKKESRDEDSI